MTQEEELMSALQRGYVNGCIKGAFDKVVFEKNAHIIRNDLTFDARDALIEELAEHVYKNLSFLYNLNSSDLRKGPQVDIIRQKRENAMTRFANLVAVATSISDSENNVTSALSGPLAEAMEIHREDQRKAAATELVGMLRSVEVNKNSHRNSLRSYRRTMKTHQKKLEAIDRAMAYGNDTNNFIPLLVEIGEVSAAHQINVDEEEFNRLKMIPNNWSPPAPTEAPPPSTISYED